MNRNGLRQVSRVVVKLGTGILTDAGNQLDTVRMKMLVNQIAAAWGRGCEVVVVSSGAVGAGMGRLGYTRRPGRLSQQQACAAVGQARLMTLYEKLFSEHGRHVGQVLLTHADLKDFDRHLNARNTLVTLLEQGVVPVINENDAVSYTELKFGDNDRLSALTACLLPADLVVILTTADGLVADFGTSQARLMSRVERIDEQVQSWARGTKSATAVGGMSTKVEAAAIATRAGIPLVVASGLREGVLGRVLAGEEEGTLFEPVTAKLRSRKRWIAFFHHPAGTLRVDEGACRALRQDGRSLLFPGIREVEGEFRKGEVVRITDLHGTEFARGLSAFDSASLRSVEVPRRAVVHRDQLVIL